MTSPISTQVVEDLKQNLYWSYLSQNGTSIEIVNLEMTVAQFWEYIDIDLAGVDAYTPNDLGTFAAE